MKPRIDITQQNSFAIWESGNWKEKDGIGRACIVAGPDGEKLDVIFDTNPTNNNFHFLFFASIGQVIATAFVRTKGKGKFQYDLELKRILNLTTEPVQGEAVARANYESLWMLKQIHDGDPGSLVDQSYKPDRLGFKEVYRTLIVTAINKAFTDSAEQRLFWGNPRTPRE